MGLRHQTYLRPRTVQVKPVTTSGTPAPLCTFRPAHRCPITAKDLSRLRPAPADGARDPVVAPHGSATQWRMNSYLGKPPTAQLTRIDAADRVFSVSLTRITSVPECAVSSVGFLWGSAAVSLTCGVSVGLAEAPGRPGRPGTEYPSSAREPRSCCEAHHRGLAAMPGSAVCPTPLAARLIG